MIARCAWCGLLLLLPLLLAAQPGERPDVETLMRAGNAAFARGDFTQAVSLYEKAERYATDPQRVALSLASAQYQRARQGDATALVAAESAYRSCSRGPYRAAALFGLASCQLLRGSLGKPDGLLLRAAIDAYTICLRDPGCDSKLAADARYNQQRARLLLLQVPPSQDHPPDEAPGSEEAPNEDRDKEKEKDGPKDKGSQQPENKGKEKQSGSAKADGKGEEGKSGDKKEAMSGGQVPLQVVSDRPDGPPLPAPEAAALLREASRRITAELLEHRRQMKRSTSPGARDW